MKGRFRAKIVDCIGSAFNAKGIMQCPNCRKIEKGNWLYANGSRTTQDVNMDEWAHDEDLYDVSYSEMDQDLLVVGLLTKESLIRDTVRGEERQACTRTRTITKGRATNSPDLKVAGLQPAGSGELGLRQGGSSQRGGKLGSRPRRRPQGQQARAPGGDATGDGVRGSRAARREGDGKENHHPRLLIWF
ncbi:hypothetical protein E2562_025325 [Oryza meyeriana var. granulata]|uniref:Uncharacterized protein n=1 Tax=Oryza meyeriana var. granulata TaxID=110450 RepID=A0A6G1EPH1_9ORYZ|nr:hypothetical protein E2562_025325 [Oryza meyeriana var. granulata]